MFLLAKYATQTTFTFPMVKAGVRDLAQSADWTPASGDAKISKNSAAVAATTNTPSVIGGTGSVFWSLTLTATELTAAVIDVQIVDSATKAVEDQSFKIYTFGNASAWIVLDLQDAVRAGLGIYSGISSMAQWLGLLSGKQTGNATARTELRASGAGSGTYDETIHSLQAFHDSTATAAQVSDAVTAEIAIKKNVGLANFPFTLYNAGTRTPATGKTVTCQKCLDADAAFSAMANSAAEVGTTGTYRITLAATDTNCTTGTWKFTATGCDPLIIHFLTQTS